MRQHKQLYRHNPEAEIYGDCQRTVFACLLDKESPANVPHFGSDGAPSGVFWDRVNAWLGQEGYKNFEMVFTGETPLSDVMRTMGVLNPGIWWMLAGTSRNKCQHVVICLGDAIAWDTSLDDSGIVAPGDDNLWRVEVLVPVCMTTLHREDGLDMIKAGTWELGKHSLG